MANFTCPACKTKSACPLPDKGGKHAIACKKCGVSLTCNRVRIRAKRSRGQNGITSYRSFDVRVIRADGTEQLIQFVNAAYSDFELRAKDQVAFIYRGPQLCSIYNLTIGIQYPVRRPNGTALLVVVIGVVLAFFVIWMVVVANR